MPRGRVLKVDVTDMAIDGDGVATVGGYVVLVRGAIPGERLLVKAVTANRKFARAEILEVLHPSPRRVAPFCRHFGPCGGCSWQHIAYPEQLRLKTGMLSTTLARRLGDAPVVKPMIGIGAAGETAPGPRGFRDKVHFVLGTCDGGKGLVLGHYRGGSKELIPIEECPVHPDAGNLAAFHIRDVLAKRGIPGTDEVTLRGIARHVIVRVAEKTGETQATLVATRADVPGLREIVRGICKGPDAPDGLHLNVNDRPGPYLLGKSTRKLHGNDRLVEEVAGTRFVLSPRAFFQTNARCAEKVVEVILGHVPTGSVLDLFAGTGLFAIPLARNGRRVVAVEENPAAVVDGIASLKENGIAPGACHFVRARVEDALRDLAEHPEAKRFDAAVLDPPREGCTPGTLDLLLGKIAPRRVAYVSCNPRVLADDLALARRLGYTILEVQPVDMFPHTAHIESVAILERPGG